MVINTKANINQNDNCVATLDRLTNQVIKLEELAASKNRDMYKPSFTLIKGGIC
jgi:hypothetical protein